MYDMLPYPNIVGATAEEQMVEMNNYLMQLKETLEFLLMDISEENLSQSLVNKLNSLGADIEKTNEDKDDQIAQVSNNNLSVSDVINSQQFITALYDVTPKEYLVSAEQIQSSAESGGINIYAIENASGQVNQFTIMNGKDGIDGTNGIDGQDGITPTFKIEEGELKISYDNGDTWTSLGYIYGENGVMGINGDDGEDGVGITKTEINSNGELIITYSNNLVSNLGVVVGAKGDKGDKGEKGDQGEQGLQGEKGDKGEQGVQGEKGQDGTNGTNGKDGVGIKTIAIDGGSLKITLTSGSTLNLGNVKGEDGKNGVDGKTPSVSFSVNFNTGNLEYITS